MSRLSVGIEKGKVDGKIESIFDFLSELGEIPEELKKRISDERDYSVLTKWLKMAARAESFDDFISKME